MPPSVDPSAATLVFKGRATTQPRRVEVDGWDLGPTGLSSDFEVEQVWKGNPGPVTSILTGLTGGACGLSFQKGKSYLVLADGMGNSWVATTCNAVLRTDEETKALADLGPPRTEYVRVSDPPRTGGGPVQRGSTESWRWAVGTGIVGLVVGCFFRGCRRG